MHKHHHCICPHDHLKYCKTCSKPYCLDCGQEWGMGYFYPSTYAYYTNPTYILTTGVNWGAGGSSGDSVTCSHLTGTSGD
jgi:hypothetical protein